jgi:hypothetical protein
MNQHAATEEAVFCEGVTPVLCNKYHAAIIRIELSSRVGSCSRELRESPELAVGRIVARKELGCAKKT